MFSGMKRGKIGGCATTLSGAAQRLTALPRSGAIAGRDGALHFPPEFLPEKSAGSRRRWAIPDDAGQRPRRDAKKPRRYTHRTTSIRFIRPLAPRASRAPWAPPTPSPKRHSSENIPIGEFPLPRMNVTQSVTSHRVGPRRECHQLSDIGSGGSQT